MTPHGRVGRRSQLALSYKPKKIAAFRGTRVLYTEPFVDDLDPLPLDRVLEESDILILAGPHRIHKRLDLNGREVVDIWTFLDDGIKL